LNNVISRDERTAGKDSLKLRSFGSVEFAEISVDGSQRKVAGFPRNFEDQTIGEPQRRAVAILLECCGHAIGLLSGEISVCKSMSMAVAISA
jgi:hypothetical protein